MDVSSAESTQIPSDTELFSLPHDQELAQQPAHPRSRIATWISLLFVGLVPLAIVGMVYMGNQTKQDTRVGASFDLKKSLTGTIDSVDVEANTFAVRLKETGDEDIRTAGYFNWTVRLAPGDTLKSARSQFCYKVPTITAPATDQTSVSCASIIEVGKPVVVEYIILYADKGELVARSIIGE